MRLQHLLPLAASLAFALPFGAQAGEWPTGAKEQYMTQCQAAAAKQVDAKTAAQHCSCGAKVIEAKFSTAEIAQLNDKTKAPPQALQQKLMNEVLVCKNQ